MTEVVLVRTSERTKFKECRQAWWWSYVERLSRKDRPPSTALRFGDLVHASLAVRYPPGRRRGPLPSRTYRRLYQAQLDEGMPPMRIRQQEDEGSPKFIDPVEFGVAILDNFIEEYGIDDRFEVVQPEQAFQIDIHNPRNGRYMFTYVSQMDSVARDLHTGRLGLFEWKTSSSSQLEPFSAPLTLDEQASAYWTFGTMWLTQMGFLEPGQDLDFMLYTFIRKAMPDPRPKNEAGHYLNKDGSVSKKQPPPYFRREWVMRGQGERETVFRRALNEFREMQMVRRGELAVYKNPGKHCTFCEFRDMCEVHETQSDWEAMRDNMFTKWDPYEAHEEPEGDNEEGE